MRIHTFPQFQNDFSAGVIQEDILMGLPFTAQRMKQVHGDRVWVITEPRVKDPEEADAMVTSLLELKLMVTTADCQAIVIADPEAKVIAAIHAGWKSLIQNIIPKTIEAMCTLGAEPNRYIVGVSPSLGPCCSQFSDPKTEIPEAFHWAILENSHVDLWAIADRQLAEAGIPKTQIDRMKICTSCNKDWFSYRRDQTTNRFGTYIEYSPYTHSPLTQTPLNANQEKPSV